MNDLIRREDVIRVVKNMEYRLTNGNTFEFLLEAISEIPSADKSGEWIDNGGTWYCSECGTEDAYACDERNGKVYDFFCPHCGARMETAVNERDYERAVEQMQHDILYEPTYNSEDRPQEWIPCSERLPTKAGHYLCSFNKPNRIDNIYVDLAYWTGGRWYGYLTNEINAWMPLPEPWKGADDD